MDIEALWSEYQSNIRSFLHSRVSNPDEVDDLLQEVLIKIYKNLHTIKSEKSIKSWLFQIANNTVIDFYRKDNKRSDIDTNELWHDDSNMEVRQELLRCLEPFINTLPEELAGLLKVIEIEGQSQKEYAEIHGLSYSTLKSRVQKARTELRRVFEKCCHFSLDQQGNILDYTEKSNHCKDC